MPLARLGAGRNELRGRGWRGNRASRAPLRPSMTRSRASLLVLAVALLAAFWLAPSFPLIVLVATLIAVGMRALADPLIERLGLPEALGVVIVLLVLIGLIALGIWLAAAPLAAQGEELMRQLPTSFSALSERLRGTGWGNWLLNHLPSNPAEDLAPQELLQGGQRAARTALGLAGGIFGGLGSAVFTLLLGLYFALHPEPYLSGLRSLLAPELRPEGRAIMEDVGTTLRYWLAGQLFSMAFIGGFVWLGLWMLGLPLAGVLAALAALLGFVPIVGPIVAAVPAVLLGAAQGLDVALWVVAIYLALHVIEGDILTPLIQSRAVNLPPGLLLMGQLFLGAVFGLLGIAVAAPLTAITMVAVQRGYVRNWLEGRGASS